MTAARRTRTTRTTAKTPATTTRRRDRLREAATGKTLGVAAIAALGALAAGAAGLFGLRRYDERRLRDDPTARPLADEVRDRATGALGEARDAVVEGATRMGDQISHAAGAARSAIAGRDGQEPLH